MYVMYVEVNVHAEYSRDCHPTPHTAPHNIAVHGACPRTVAFSRRQHVDLGFPITLVDSL